MSIETAFLLEVSTSKPQRWSMGPRSWACSWANQNLMCLLRDPAVHQSVLHHSGQRDGLSPWRTSDTWRPQTGPEILREWWWGWIDKREGCCLYCGVSDDCVCDCVCLQLFHSLSSHVYYEARVCVFVCLFTCSFQISSADWWIWLVDWWRALKWWNRDNDCSISQRCQAAAAAVPHVP